MGPSANKTLNSFFSLGICGPSITEVAVLSTLCSFLKNPLKSDLEVQEFVGWKGVGVLIQTFFDLGDLKSSSLSIFFLCKSFSDAFGEIIACVYFFTNGVWDCTGVEIYESDFLSSHCRHKSKKEDPYFFSGLNITGE